MDQHPSNHPDCTEPPDDRATEKKPECENPAGGTSGYYYDDATGYEVYDPAADDEDDEESDAPLDRSD